MRLRFLLSCCCLLFACPLVGHAEPLQELIETLPNGCINWTKGLLEAKGSSPSGSLPDAGSRSEEQMVRQARQEAAKHMLQTMHQVRMDGTRYISHMMSLDYQVGAKGDEMAAAAPVVAKHLKVDGKMEVTVQMALLGPLAQLVLPESIKQVDTIKSINSVADETEDEATSEVIGRQASTDRSNAYTGLIVDARGTGAKPAMVPLLVDESGKEVYGSVFVSREYAVQQGVCMYASALAHPEQHPRVGPNPLVVKGLRTFVDRNCDIVISNADAAKLMDVSANLGFLKQCRVMIILDP